MTLQSISIVRPNMFVLFVILVPILTHISHPCSFFLKCPTQMSYCDGDTGEPAQFAFCISRAFIRTMFRRAPSLYNIDSCVLKTTSIKVLKPSPQCSGNSPPYWSAMKFRENVKASSVKYLASTTIPQMWQHLRHLKGKFSDVRGALVV